MLDVLHPSHHSCVRTLCGGILSEGEEGRARQGAAPSAQPARSASVSRQLTPRSREAGCLGQGTQEAPKPVPVGAP